MHRQLAEPGEVRSEGVALTREAARHCITVLRLQVGDELELFDGAGASATFRLCADGAEAGGGGMPDARRLLREGRLALRRVGDVRLAAPRTPPLILAPCVSKGARMDWTVEKAVELGVARIVPVASDNCVVAFRDGGAAEAHRARWRRIAAEAARQCGSPFVPEIDAPAPLDAALAALRAAGARLFAGGLVPDAIPFRDALAAAAAAAAGAPRAWLVGPEGDFSPREYERLRAAGAALVTLGPLVLRTETAAVFGLCVLSTL